MATITKQDVRVALQTILAVGDAIRELGIVPSGELYGRLMTHGISLESYNAIINQLKRADLVSEDGFNLLTWIGPQKQVIHG